MNTFTKAFVTLAVAFTASTAYATPRYPDPLGGQNAGAESARGVPNFAPKESSLDFTLEALSTPEGVEALKNKIRATAREVCYLNKSQEDESLEVASAKKKCYNRAIKTAMESVDKLVIAANEQKATNTIAYANR